MSEPGLARLANPLWIASLLVLVLNDHVLKGSGILPGWLTGKLSDFAGLIVAPVLASACIAKAGALAQRLSFCAVVCVFGAVKVWEPATHAIEDAMGWLGVTWRLWTDPTDLLALLVVPLAWHVAYGTAPLRGRPTWADRLRVVAGAIACVATSGVADFETPAYVVNRTNGTIDVTVLRLNGRLDCELLRGQTSQLIDRSWFELDARYSLQPRRVLPLEDREFEEVQDCGAVVLVSEGMPDTLVAWPDGRAESVPKYVDGDEPSLDMRGVEIQRSGEGLRATTPSDLEVTELDAPQPRCELPRGEALDWSFPMSQATAVLESVSTDAGGCLDLDFGAAGSATLCVPEWAFPFMAGQSLRFSASTALVGSAESPSHDSLIIAVSNAPYPVLEAHRGATPQVGSPVDSVSAAVCIGERLSCGAIVVPGRGAGQSLDRALVGYSELVHMSRVEHVVVGRPECSERYQTPGPKVDYFILRTEAP